MSMPIDHAYWASLNYGGLLLSPAQQAKLGAAPLPAMPVWQAEQLRRATTAFDGKDDSLAALLDFMLEIFTGLPAHEWQKAGAVERRWAIQSYTGGQVKPRRIWQGPNGETLPVFVPQEGASRQLGGRLGVGKSRHLLGRVVEWLRRLQQPIALVTNGRQWRLIHAGADYEAFCEFDIDYWFEEGQPGAQTKAWRYLLNRQTLLAGGDGGSGAAGSLLTAIRDSRKGQAELSAVLGERVRQAVEELITASHPALVQAQANAPAYKDLYLAGSRIIMRTIVTLFAEARALLPVDNPIYHRAYSLEGLRQQLDKRAGSRHERLNDGTSAWPRLIGLFNLIYHGSAHAALPVPQYSGDLFAPGDANSSNPISRALALLESSANAISDKQVRSLLRLLTRTRMKVQQGRKNTWVDGPVDFSALSSEYIGILYEGLLDFELKRAGDDEPVLFLAVGNQPALTLSQLEGMDDKSIKQLFEALKKKDKNDGDDDEAGEGSAADEAGDGDDAVPDDEEVTDADAATPAVDAEDSTTDGGDEPYLLRAQAWLEKAALLSGQVKKARGKGVDAAQQAQAVRAAGKALCARLVAPGQFFLVRWGGTRKGAGTFYTRPQLAAPTVRRTLQPLAYDALRTEIDARTGLEEVAEWVPKTPAAILALKVCDPAMGSGSFLVGALRYLTDALLQSLYHHQLIYRSEDGGVPRMADGAISEVLGDELLKLRPEHEGFEEALRAQLKRHIVERCLYGVDLDPLAVELGRMALWVETMDRDLPFGFLDHKLKVGNSLVGAWFDTYRDYPAMAWQREGGDKDYQKGKPDNLINHFYIAANGKKLGDKFTAAIKERGSHVPEQLIAILSGQLALEQPEEAADVHKELLAVFKKLHRLPMHDTDKRAKLYREQVLNNPHYHALKDRMDLWCALWLWPGESIEQAPLPRDFAVADEAVLAVSRAVAQQHRFFHWELEFPDVFTPQQSGFDAILGNPPWEIQKPSSKEFFSNHDPLYRAYGKQDALAKQLGYFAGYVQLEYDWIGYNARIKSMSNWVKNVGQPFGDNVITTPDGKKRHGINLGTGRNSFAASAALHKKWQQQRNKRKGFADAEHPFLHQGSADLNTYKMFLELCYALLHISGRLGVIVPSGIHTDKGATALRELFLNRCDWQWLFGFENRDKIFDIDSRFKFCPLIVNKGGATQFIRAAFMHRNIDDWEYAENHILVYPHTRITTFSPYTKAILEIRNEKDLQVLQTIYGNSVLLGDQTARGYAIKYAREFDMTNDSNLFQAKSKWEKMSYVPTEYGQWVKGNWCPNNGLNDILSRKAAMLLSHDKLKVIHIADIEDVALPLFQGGMVNLYDNNAAGFIEKASAQANWQQMTFEEKEILPQFLLSYNDCLKKGERYQSGVKFAFRDIARNTDVRSAIGSLIDGFPCGNTLGVFSSTPETIASVGFAFSSIAFDWVLRKRLGGTHINLFVAEECAISENFRTYRKYFILPFLSLTFPAVSAAKAWCEFDSFISKTKSWRRLWAVTDHERSRLKALLEAIAFHLYGLDHADVLQILAGLDVPSAQLKTAAFNKTLDVRGFWRIDKDKDPELRHTVLSLVAFHDLQEKGLDAFLAQNDGEGWLIPETLRLADYGLGHDDRAQEHQPVASRLGPRFYDWQLNEDIERSWQECAAHAALINRIVPPPPAADADTTATEDGTPTLIQGDLF